MHELIINMCALVLYHSRKVAEYAESGGPNSDGDARVKARHYADVAETLIMRLQDTLDYQAPSIWD